MMCIARTGCQLSSRGIARSLLSIANGGAPEQSRPMRRFILRLMGLRGWSELETLRATSGDSTIVAALATALEEHEPTTKGTP